MPKLPYPSLNALPAEAAAALKAFPAPLNIVRMTAHAPTLLGPLLELCTAVMTSLELKPKHREMLILLVAHETQCPYEWSQHLPQAAAAGVTPDDIVVITDSSRQSPEPAERCLLTVGRAYLAEEPHTHGIVPDLQECFSDREIVEVLYLLGYMRMFCLAINALDPELDPAGDAMIAGFAQMGARAGTIGQGGTA